MLHPLLALAAAYDHAVPLPNERPSLECLLRSCLRSATPDEAICHYAGHFSVLTQAYQLGDHGVLEEPQTDALYGLLASSFWHARVLDDAYLASLTAASEEYDKSVPRKRYWMHQSKTQEVESGFDFGIVTLCDEGKVKVTLFQAKRPSNDAKPAKLSLGHVVREGRGLRLHRDENELQKDLHSVQQKIDDAVKFDKSKDLELLRRKKEKFECEKENWSDHTVPRAQLKELAKIRDAFSQGKTVDSVLKSIKNTKEFTKNITPCREDSLFNKNYSYEQYYAFLATAIRGWLWEDAQTLPNGWCHYAQWVNRSAGEPWSLRLEEAFALGKNEQAGENRRRFAEVLVAALSSKDRTVGLMVYENELRDLAGLIMSDLPGLVWGAVAEREDIALELLYQCGVSEAEIAHDISRPDPRAVARMQQPDNDRGNGNATHPPFGKF